MPAELKIPIESSDINSARIAIVVLQGLIANDINNGTHDSGGITCNSVQKWFKPSCKGIPFNIIS